MNREPSRTEREISWNAQNRDAGYTRICRFYENGMFQAGNAQLLPVNTAVIQGSLEGSNVDLSAEMTRTMEIQRAFQSCSKALTIIDQMNQKTVSEIGKTQGKKRSAQFTRACTLHTEKRADGRKER